MISMAGCAGVTVRPTAHVACELDQGEPEGKQFRLRSWPPCHKQHRLVTMLLDVAAFAWARPQAAPLLPPPADRATVCNHRTACVYGDGVETKLYQPKKKEAVSAEDPQSQAMFGRERHRRASSICGGPPPLRAGEPRHGALPVKLPLLIPTPGAALGAHGCCLRGSCVGLHPKRRRGPQHAC